MSDIVELIQSALNAQIYQLSITQSFQHCLLEKNTLIKGDTDIKYFFNVTYLIFFAPCLIHDYECVCVLNMKLIYWGELTIYNYSCTGPDWTRPAPPGSRCVFYTY